MSDLYQMLGDALRPMDTPVIRDITIDHRKHGFVVTCEVENGNKPYQVHHISECDVCDWIEESHPEWLEWQTDKPHPVTGEHVQEVGVITAEEYAVDHMTEDEWHEYLIAQNLTTYQYDPE